VREGGEQLGVARGLGLASGQFFFVRGCPAVAWTGGPSGRSSPRRRFLVVVGEVVVVNVGAGGEFGVDTYRKKGLSPGTNICLGSQGSVLVIY
jgi:hypothetical protein